MLVNLHDLIYYSFISIGPPLLFERGYVFPFPGFFLHRFSVSKSGDLVFSCCHLWNTANHEPMGVRMEGNKLYVGNLSYSVTSEQLKELFSGYGEVGSVRIIEGKGFGFVEMTNQADAEKAKKELDGSQFLGRTLKIDEARPQKERPHGGSRGPRKY